jgi:hypothetical protein
LPGIDSGTTLTGSIAGGKIINILHRAFTADKKLSLKNLGTTELVFGLSPDEITLTGGVILLAGEEKEVFANELGDIGYHYLNIKNNDAVTEGEYSVKIL